MGRSPVCYLLRETWTLNRENIIPVTTSKSIGSMLSGLDVLDHTQTPYQLYFHPTVHQLLITICGLLNIVNRPISRLSWDSKVYQASGRPERLTSSRILGW